MAIDMNQARKGKLTANAHYGVASATIAAFELFDGLTETVSAERALEIVSDVLAWSVLSEEGKEEIRAVLRAERGLPDREDGSA